MPYINRDKPRMFEFVTNNTSSSWSITTVAGDIGPFDIEIPSTLTGTILSAYLDMYIATMYNSNAGTNYINGDCYVKVRKDSAGSYTNAIYIPNNSFDVLAQGYYTLGRIYGNIDISSKVSAGSTTNALWYQVKSKNNDLTLESYRAFILRLYMR